MKHWKKILIKADDKLEYAIRVMHEGGWQLALVIDESEKLIGILTDGDLRRALIKQITMDTDVRNVMNNNPISMNDRCSDQEIIKTMKEEDLKHMPLINTKGVITNLIPIEKFINNRNQVNPVLLMAGGFGKRLHPFTDEIPKPMLKVGTKPILEKILNSFISQGFINFLISLHYKGEIIKSYFGDGSGWGVNIKYIQEKKPLGTAGCLSLIDDIDKTFPIIIMNGDLLTMVNYKYLLDFHSKQPGQITMCVKEHNIEVPYGVIEVENNLLINIEEKPIKRFNVNAGIYVLDSSVFSLVKRDTYIDMTDLIICHKKNNGQVNVFPLFEDWKDIGRKEDLSNAILDQKDTK